MNTFAVIDYKKHKNILVTNSARKAKRELHVGVKIEVWNNNMLTEIIYARASKSIDKYVSIEKEYIKMKQTKAETRNRRRLCATI